MVHCRYVPIAEDAVDSGIFARNDDDIPIESLELFVDPKNLEIPANLLSRHFVMNKMFILCENIGTQKLKIHPDAFRSSRNFSRYVRISWCDLMGLDFFFLKDFAYLEHLVLYYNAQFSLAEWLTLPTTTLSNCANFDIFSSTGVDDWATFPVLIQGLITMDISSNKISDLAVDRILQWILDSPSISTLKKMDISYNELTEIPKKLLLFENLQEIDISFNPIDGIIRAGSFKSFLTSKSYVLNLEMMGINKIEPGTFIGIVDNVQCLSF